jgi:SPP1 family predicted phage head-tail adaptor
VSRPVSISALRHRVTIEAAVDSPDGAGGFTRAYAPLAQVWAWVRPKSAREQFVEQRLEQARTHLVVIRWRADVEAQMRFDFRGRRLFVRSVVDPDETRRFLHCECEEIS